MALAFVLGLISFVTLMNVTGRRTGSTELYTGPLYGIPADLLTVIIGTGWLVMSMAVLSMVNSNIADFMLAGGLVLIIGNTFLGYCMSIAARVKGKTLWKNTLISQRIIFAEKNLQGKPVYTDGDSGDLESNIRSRYSFFSGVFWNNRIQL